MAAATHSVVDNLLSQLFNVPVGSFSTKTMPLQLEMTAKYATRSSTFALSVSFLPYHHFPVRTPRVWTKQHLANLLSLLLRCKTLSPFAKRRQERSIQLEYHQRPSRSSLIQALQWHGIATQATCVHSAKLRGAAGELLE